MPNDVRSAAALGPPVRPAAWQPSARAQWAAIAVAVIWSTLLAVVLPRVADATVPHDEVLDAGSRIAAGGVSVVPSEGWTREGEVTDLLRLTKSGTNLLFFPASPSTESVVDVVSANAEIFGEEAGPSLELGEPVQFSTDSGLDAASLVVLDQGHATLLAAFSDGRSMAMVQADMTQQTWVDLADEINGMLTTVQLTDGGAP